MDDAIAYSKTIAKQFAITLGESGSIVFDGKAQHQIKPNPVEAIDTVGAGDMYAGAFLYGITHGQDFPTAGALASRASARVVTKYGPRLSTAEITELLVA